VEVVFKDACLEDVYYSPKASIGHGPAVDKGFRKVIGAIKAAKNELDLRAMKGMHYHKLEGVRSHQHALNITNQWRLIIERVEREGRTELFVVSIEDYH